MTFEWNYFVDWDMALAMTGCAIILVTIRHSEKEVHRGALGRLRDLFVGHEECDLSGVLVREDGERIVLFGIVGTEAAMQLAGSLAVSVFRDAGDSEVKFSNQLVVAGHDQSERNDRPLAA